MQARHAKTSKLSLPLSLLVLLLPGLGCSGGKPSAGDRAAPSKVKLADDPGTLDRVDAKKISGWAWDPARPDEVVNVEIREGDRLLTTLPADVFRQDLAGAKKGNGKHAFVFKTPATLGDGQPHTIHVRVAEAGVELKNSPKTLQFTSP